MISTISRCALSYLQAVNTPKETKMKDAKVFFLLVAAMFGVAVCGPQSPTNTAIDAKSRARERKDLVESIEKKTVALVHKDGDEISPYCSGVWVGPEEILTAFHCIEGGPTVLYKTLVDTVEEETVAKLIDFDEENDLALLHADPKTMKPHLVGEPVQETWDGQHVNIVGHTTGLWWTYLDGVISSTRTRDDSKKRPRLILQISSPAWFGNSGGGAWDDQGFLIGISSFVTTRAPLMTFFIHHEHIKQLMAKSRIKSSQR